MDVSAYLTAIVTPLLRHPDALVLVESEDAMGVLLTITVHQEDMGVVVGKKGETSQSIRHLVRIVGIMNKARVSIKINEPDGSPYKPKF